MSNKSIGKVAGKTSKNYLSFESTKLGTTKLGTVTNGTAVHF